jgi:hypothetical protein
MKKVVERYEMHTRFWYENIKGRNHFKDLIVCRRVVLKHALRDIPVGFIWLRTGASGGVL